MIQKIIMMPQLVEVVKHVHEIFERENIGPDLSGRYEDISQDEVALRRICTNLITRMKDVLEILKTDKNSVIRNRTVEIE